jgi:hypothetical protein
MKFLRRQSRQPVQERVFVHESPEQPSVARISMTDGRAYSGRAAWLQNSLVLQSVIFLLLIVVIWQAYEGQKALTEVANRGYVVFHDQCGKTVVGTVADYQTGASDEEIKGTAWDVVRLIVGAGSEDVKKSFEEARLRMTSEMQIEFNASLGQYEQIIKQQNIYNKIENGQVRQLEPTDLPPGSQIKPTRYDVIVTGIVQTYDNASRTKISEKAISFLVSTVPLKRRTIQNRSGLLVKGLKEFTPIKNQPSTQPSA